MAEFNGTPHNSAKVGQIAKTVLMPGDPLRAKFIRETFLTDAKEFNHVRGMLGFTGKYKGVDVSVMGSGMGIPSMGIYSYELYKFYGVENIIRIGTAGSGDESLHLFDVVLADSSYSRSSYAKNAFGYEEDIQYPSKSLVEKIERTAKELGKPVHKGLVSSGDCFYRAPELKAKKKYKYLAGEMESFALFSNARYLNKNAACLLTISDDHFHGEIATTERRETAFTSMMEIALETAIRL
jgi:purine-nucleoside phosphorylase